MAEKIVNKLILFASELLGTALLIFLGCLGCISWSNQANSIAAPFSFGLVVAIIVQCFGYISGAHLNPAISLAALITNVLSFHNFLIYFFAQMIGSFMGFGLLIISVPSSAISTPGDDSPGLCTTTPNPDITAMQAVIIEIVATFVLVFMTCSFWDPRNGNNTDSASIKFGICVGVLAYAAGPFTGGSLNPARSFGPSIWNKDYESQWIYWVGPIIGALLAGLLYKAVFKRNYRETVQEISTNDFIEK